MTDHTIQQTDPLPEMPEPRVRETTAHSIPGGLGLLLTVLGVALTRLAEQEIVELDSERKAAMVSNLMVVLCGDRAAQPVLNTGTLYQ